ncbi:unnamed protein product [Eruca vesicaria subsp. sativa]|uniref:Secreted protein n=1 Tax=Eruca vesicaria subsp. sativa TaxID=29727 RepID=A0ABC8K835_ERUVS|nr:unnamed protein product [Eruca vesicaria subsp. sativa]
MQVLLLVACAMTVVAWLVTSHRVLNNVLEISMCIAFARCVRSSPMQASNPVHRVANSLNLPGLQLITKKL